MRSLTRAMPAFICDSRSWISSSASASEIFIIDEDARIAGVLSGLLLGLIDREADRSVRDESREVRIVGGCLEDENVSALLLGDTQQWTGLKLAKESRNKDFFRRIETTLRVPKLKPPDEVLEERAGGRQRDLVRDVVRAAAQTSGNLREIQLAENRHRGVAAVDDDPRAGSIILREKQRQRNGSDGEKEDRLDNQPLPSHQCCVEFQEFHMLPVPVHAHKGRDPQS